MPRCPLDVVSLRNKRRRRGQISLHLEHAGRPKDQPYKNWREYTKDSGHCGYAGIVVQCKD